MKPLKAAIAGCGTIAMMKHLPALRNNGAEIIALFDKSMDAAMCVKKQFGTSETKIYDNYDLMLKDERIEAVFVLTPNYLHADMTIKALDAKKNVMCEKPMATNYRDAKAMIEARDRSGKLLTIGYQNRQRPDSLYMKKECFEGAFGDIYFAKAKAIRRRMVPTWGLFFNKEVQGGGVLIDVATHALDLTLYMMNNYEPSYCVGTTYKAFSDAKQPGNEWGDWDDRSYDVEDAAFGFVVMKNGATIILESSWALNICDSGESQTLIAGTKGGADMFDGLRINGVKHNTQYILRPDVQRTKNKPFLPNRTPDDLECEIFIKAIRGQGDLCVTAEQAATVTQILEGIYVSAETQKPHYFD